MLTGVEGGVTRSIVSKEGELGKAITGGKFGVTRSTMSGQYGLPEGVTKSKTTISSTSNSNSGMVISEQSW